MSSAEWTSRSPGSARIAPSRASSAGPKSQLVPRSDAQQVPAWHVSSTVGHCTRGTGAAEPPSAALRLTLVVSRIVWAKMYTRSAPDDCLISAIISP